METLFECECPKLTWHKNMLQGVYSYHKFRFKQSW